MKTYLKFYGLVFTSLLLLVGGAFSSNSAIIAVALAMFAATLHFEGNTKKPKQVKPTVKRRVIVAKPPVSQEAAPSKFKAKASEFGVGMLHWTLKQFFYIRNRSKLWWQRNGDDVTKKSKGFAVQTLSFLGKVAVGTWNVISSVAATVWKNSPPMLQLFIVGAILLGVGSLTSRMGLDSISTLLGIIGMALCFFSIYAGLQPFWKKGKSAEARKAEAEADLKKLELKLQETLAKFSADKSEAEVKKIQGQITFADRLLNDLQKGLISSQAVEEILKKQFGVGQNKNKNKKKGD